MPTLADKTATQLLQLYRTKQASPVEVTQAVFERIARVNPAVNAFALLDEEKALAAARESEARWQSNRPMGLLDGVPTSIKDLILTKGWPTLRGSRTVDPYGQAWDQDAPVTARLREAGAVLIGKTTTPEFGCKGTTDNFLTGITRNPWNCDMTPGGSSGGAAVAVACGMGPLAVGTDGAGSIRIPAAFCGGFGLKPSFGRVPAWPLSPFGTVAHLGPHTMSVEDAALMLTVISKPDTRDWTSLPYYARDYRIGLHEGVAGLRIAFSSDLGYVKNIDPEVAVAVRDAARMFEALGARIDEVSPDFANPEEITTKLWFVGAMSIVSGLNAEQKALLDPAMAWEAEQGERVTMLEHQKLVARRGELGTHMRRFHERYDLLLTPAVSVPAFAAKATGEWELSHEAFLGWTPFSYPFNLTQQPAAVIACGLSKAGLPLSLQIVGPMHSDALVLRAARAYESVRPIPRPDVARLTR